jgi:hypothetical protein
MSRPMSKNELLELSEINFNRLLDFINELPVEYKSKEYNNNELNDKDKTIKDIICHLHEWHLVIINWYKAGISGKESVILGDGYKGKTLSGSNEKIYEKYKRIELKQAITLFKTSHKEIMKIVEKHNDEELFTKKKYKWTGTTSLAAYLILATSSHYDWGLKTIKPIKKIIKDSINK